MNDLLLLLVLLLGLALGSRLPGLRARWRRYRRRKGFKPVLLRPYSPRDERDS